MRFTRRRFLGGAAAAAVGGAGIYELVDQLVGSPSRPSRRRAAQAARVRPEHDRDRGRRRARAAAAQRGRHGDRGGRRSARRPSTTSSRRSPDLDARYPLNPAGLGVTIAWGLPYFEQRVRGAGEAHLPFDRRAGKSALLPRAASRATRTPRCSRRTTSRSCSAATRASTSTTHTRRSSKTSTVPRRRACAAASPGGSTGGRACRSGWRSQPASPAPT